MNANNAHATFLKLALAFGVAVAVVEIGWLVTAPLPYDAFGYMIGRLIRNSNGIRWGVYGCPMAGRIESTVPATCLPLSRAEIRTTAAAPHFSMI